MDSGIMLALGEIARSLSFFSEGNARLYLPNSGNQLIQDPDTGNWVLSEGSPTEVIAQLIQKQATSVPMEGLNYNAVYLEGFLVNPVSLTVPIPRKVNCGLLYQGVWRQGVFYSLETFSDTIADVSQFSTAIGQPITGWFEVMEGN